jgi:hypothetical protein
MHIFIYRLHYELIRESIEIQDMFMNEYDQTHTSTYPIGIEYIYIYVYMFVTILYE